jgi:hypothetical protein
MKRVRSWRERVVYERTLIISGKELVIVKNEESRPLYSFPEIWRGGKRTAQEMLDYWNNLGKVHKDRKYEYKLLSEDMDFSLLDTQIGKTLFRTEPFNS